MLKARSKEEEIMDDLAIEGEVIQQTLRELDTINQLLGGNQISLKLFKKLAQGQKEISLADLGCGGGDIMVSMAKWCRKRCKSTHCRICKETYRGLPRDNI